jgi:hypothetical protein
MTTRNPFHRIGSHRSQPRQIVAAVLGACALLAAPARALMLGDLDTRSHLGDGFHGRIPVQRSPGEELDAACIRVRSVPDTASGGEPLRDPRATVERVGARDFIVVRTHRSIHDPIVAFRVELGCSNRLARDYLALIDPAPVSRLIPEAGPVGAAVAIEAPPAANTATTNAAPATTGATTPLQQRTRQARASNNALPPDAMTTAPAAIGSAPARSDVRQPARQSQEARTVAPKPAATAATGAPASRATTDPSPQSTRVVLRVETELPDTTASARLSEADRDVLRRTSALVMHGDDQVAAVLALQDRLRQLEARVGDLQAAMARPPAGAAPAPAAPLDASPPREAAAAVAAGTQTGPAAAAVAHDLRPLAVGSVLALAAVLAGSVYWRARRRQSRTAQTPPNDTATIDVAPTPAGSIAETVVDVAPGDSPVPTPLDLAIAPGDTPVNPIDTPTNARAEPEPLDLSIATGAFATIRTARDPAPAFDAAVRRGSAAAKDLAPIEFTLDPGPSGTASASPTTTTAPGAYLDPATEEGDGNATSGLTPAPRQVQERYFVERYGADALGAAPLGDPEALVRQARMHYQDDGDLFKSIDLLELAIAFNPAAERPWLALFAILSGERMHWPFESLARRYREQCPDHRHWPSIRRLGREIDRGNPLYGVQDVTGSVGPGAEGLIEEWLGVPLDFTSHLMLVELREALVRSATTEATAAVDAAA